MKHFKVLGSGCSNCVNTAKLIETLAQQCDVEVDVSKVSDMEAILAYNVMSTPAVVMDGQVVHSGSVPKPELVLAWLKE